MQESPYTFIHYAVKAVCQILSDMIPVQTQVIETRQSKVTEPEDSYFYVGK